MVARLPLLEVGAKFGDWTVVGQLEKEHNGKENVPFSRVRCACGKVEKDLLSSYLRAGKTNGCGCKRGLALAYSGITHGKSRTPIYRLWAAIKHRLGSQASYAGIGMYGPWMIDFVAFETFILSLGPKPTPQHTLDRIDSNGDYAPDNLRWADKTLQSVNRRNNMLGNLEANSKVAVGQKYDLLTVEELIIRRAYGRNWYAARVRCECGTIKVVHQKQLLSEKTKSCGCFKNRNLLLGAQAQEKPITANGETLSLHEWARRGGMSVQVIWNRINKLGWEPSRAVTETKMVPTSVTIDGVTKSVVTWCKDNGLNYTTVHRRIHKLGWDPARAVTEPFRPKKPSAKREPIPLE